MTNLERADRILHIANADAPYVDPDKNKAWRRAQIAMELYFAKMDMVRELGNKLSNDAHLLASEPDGTNS